MSLSAATDKFKAPILHRTNLSSWIEHGKDYIHALDCDEAADIWQAYIFDPTLPANANLPDPADHDYQTCTNAVQRKLRTQHNKAWRFLRAHLSVKLFNTTKKLPMSVPKLLRHLKAQWVDANSVSDRNAMRETFNAMKLSMFDDVEDFVTAFDAHVQIMIETGIMHHTPEDLLYQLNTGLPSAWSEHRNLATANGMSYDDACAYYIACAKKDSSLPGTLCDKADKAPGSVHFSSEKSSAQSSAHNERRTERRLFDEADIRRLISETILNTTETCRNFAEGHCPRGASCRYRHIGQAHGAARQPASSGQRVSQLRHPELQCDHCSKPGHIAERCWLKHPHLRPLHLGRRQRATDSTHATQQLAADLGTDSISIGDCVYSARDEILELGSLDCDEVCIDDCVYTDRGEILELGSLNRDPALPAGLRGFSGPLRLGNWRPSSTAHNLSVPKLFEELDMADAFFSVDLPLPADYHSVQPVTTSLIRGFSPVPVPSFVLRTSPSSSATLDCAYSMHEEGPARVYDSALLTTLLPALRGTLFVLDGASTCGVVEDESLCTNVRDADIYIKTGGQGKPNLVHCRKVGDLTVKQVVDGRTVVLKLTVRIVPGFGVNILPESYFLKKNFSVNKTGNTVRIQTPDNKLVLTGSAQRHDASWLFYVELTVVREGLAKESVSVTADDTRLAKESVSVTADDTPVQQHPIFEADWDNFVASTLAINTGEAFVPISDVCLPPDVPVAFFTVADEGERERCTLLPVTQPYDQVYATTMSRGPTVELIQLWHARYGHRNYRDVALMLGVALPENMPPCIECITGKSKRQPLTGSDGLHEAPRPGYAIAWDHEGPFANKTWGGSTILSLKVDIFSGKLFPKWVSSTGDVASEWLDLVLKLIAHFGRQVVAQRLTDNAPYFRSNAINRVDSAHGITHVPAPSYTQEFNGTAERLLGTLLPHDTRYDEPRLHASGSCW